MPTSVPQALEPAFLRLPDTLLMRIVEFVVAAGAQLSCLSSIAIASRRCHQLARSVKATADWVLAPTDESAQLDRLKGMIEKPLEGARKNSFGSPEYACAVLDRVLRTNLSFREHLEKPWASFHFRSGSGKPWANSRYGTELDPEPFVAFRTTLLLAGSRMTDEFFHENVKQYAVDWLTVEALLRHLPSLPGSSVNTTFLKAAEDGQDRCVKLLVEKFHADIAAFGNRALSKASWSNHPTTVKLLLTYGANPVNETDDNGYPLPLSNAGFLGSRDMMSALLEHGADINAKTDEALFFSMFGLEMDECATVDTINYLLDNGSSLSHAPDRIIGALVMAGKVDVVKVVFEHSRLQSSVTSNIVNTAVIFACVTGNLDLITYLLGHPLADPNFSRTFDDNTAMVVTPLATATSKEAQKLLREAGATVPNDNSGATCWTFVKSVLQRYDGERYRLQLRNSFEADAINTTEDYDDDEDGSGSDNNIDDSDDDTDTDDDDASPDEVNS
ncbi:hypothetical protein HDU85_000675 [Gaertneriomyces sp. JEL0708]|nr:hypothetical protein HDU85_000675 [Gaertneriomyces sp. JEL0708]